MLLALLATLGALAQARAAAGSRACVAAADYTTPDEPLDHVAAAIAAGGPLNVLAIGSASTVGIATASTGATAPGRSYPYEMADALHAARPGLVVHLTVGGGRGMTAEAMLPLLHRALKAQKYQLVLWQTGTVEAVRGLRPDEMQAALEEGIDLAQRAGADLVLIDSQFSRFLRANADLDPYQAVLQQVATIPGVVLFHRFDLMSDWAHEGRIDLERTRRADRQKAIAKLNTCLGSVLARFVLNGAALQ